MSKEYVNRCEVCGRPFIDGFCCNDPADDDEPKISDRELDKLIAISEAAFQLWTPEQRQEYEDHILTNYPEY